MRPTQPPRPGQRTRPRANPRALVGGLAVVLLIVLWAALVASLSGTVGRWPVLAQALFYLVAGVAWVVPLRPLVRWTGTGRFRRG